METSEILLKSLQFALLQKSKKVGSTYRKVRSDYMIIMKSLRVLVPELLVKDVIDIILNTETMEEVETKIENVFNSDNYTTASANVFKLAEIFPTKEIYPIYNAICLEEACQKNRDRLLLFWFLSKRLFHHLRTVP